MSIFSVKNSAKNRAWTYEAMVHHLQGQQADIDFGRQMLSNIREQRIAESMLTTASVSDDFVSSSHEGAKANLQSTFADAAGYSYDTSKRADEIQDYQEKAADAWEEYYSSVAKAKQATMAVAAVGALAGGVFLGPALAAAMGEGAMAAGLGAAGGAAIGGLAGTGLAYAAGGNHVVGNAGLAQTLKSSVSAGTTAYAGSVFEGLKTSNAVVEAGGTMSHTYTPIYDTTPGNLGFSENLYRGVW